MTTSRPVARTFVREISSRCLSEPGVLVSLISAIAIDKGKTIFAKDPTTGPMGIGFGKTPLSRTSRSRSLLHRARLTRW